MASEPPAEQPPEQPIVSPQRMKEIFSQAVELPPAARRSFVQQQCADDRGLLSVVMSLIEAHERAEGFLDRPTMLPTAEAMAPPDHPTHVGPYEIIRQVGEGGFGTVYLAEQKQPVARRVAVKILKPGMDSRQILARFNAERQTLGLMDHPNIARVLDAGTTDAGRPYFVMEFVDGVPVTQYCDEHRLPTRARLELFAQICQAVHHAHQKGIIHRDIKPSNVMVTEQDGRPVPKVIDFGVSKAMQQQSTATMMTDSRQLIGTPEYMSPEQAGLDTTDIDTRSDVYSLGVLLYELLTGTTPFDSRQLRAAAMMEMQRMIREVEPPRPSTRLSRIESAADIATRRNTEPRKLASTIRGELDWIVMKCLEKDRARRYESAASLAVDVGHFLSNEPVAASPASATYRFRKLVKRNKLVFASTTLVALALITAVAALGWGMVQIRAERDRTRQQLDRAVAAEQREREQRQIAQTNEQSAKDETAIAETVTTFLQDMLESANAYTQRNRVTTGKDVTIRELFDAVIRRIDQGEIDYLKDQPLLEASIRMTLGKSLNGLGHFPAAEQQLRKSLALREAHLGAEHLDVAIGLNELSLVLAERADFKAAEPLTRRALAIYEKQLGADHPDAAVVQNNLARVVRILGKSDEAEQLYRKSLETAVSKSGPESLAAATRYNNLAMFLQEQLKWGESAELIRKALAIWKKELPANHPTVAKGLGNLAIALQGQDQFDDALGLMRESLTIREASLDADHPDVAKTKQNVAAILIRMNKPAEAEPLYRAALTALSGRLGDTHPSVSQVQGNLAKALVMQDRMTEAETLYKAALASRRISLGGGHPQTLRIAEELAQVYHKLNRQAEAEKLLIEVIAQRQQQSPLDEKALSDDRSILARIRAATQPATAPTAGGP